MQCCSQCVGIEKLFDTKSALKQLKKYKKAGAGKATSKLIKYISENARDQFSLLDIGGGIGAIQLELLKKGAKSVTNVDASKGYLYVAEKEAEQRNLSDKISYYHGDYLNICSEIVTNDIVTLDKVVCCYPDMDSLIKNSVLKSRKFYGLVFPRETIPVKILAKAANLYFKITKNPFRMYVHSIKEINNNIESFGFKKIKWSNSGMWKIVLYKKVA